MKRSVFCFALVLAMVVALFASSNAMATPKYVKVTPIADADGNVTIPEFPAGTTLVNVEIYDDVRGTKPVPIGPKHNFRLELGQGFNFLWSDAEGTWYQMITPATKPSGYLAIDCSNIGGCKYLYPDK